MTGNNEERASKGRKSPSSRLSINGEDAWRSWRDLPADADADSDGERSADGKAPKMPTFGGSMLVVVAPVDPAPTAESPGSPATDGPITDVVPVLTTGAVDQPADAPGGRSSAPRLPILDRPQGDSSAPASSAPTRKPAADSATLAEAVFVLDSDAVERTPRRAPANGSRRNRSGARARTGEDPPSVSGLVADAVALLEAHVARQQTDTEELLTTLHERYATQIANLDSRLADEVHQADRGIPKDFEDRVYASFMQLVQRLELLEQRPEPAAPVAEPEPRADESNDPAAAAVTTFLLDQHEQLGSRQDDLAEAHQGLQARVERLDGEQARRDAELRALVDQQIQLAEGQRLLADAHRRHGDDLDGRLAETSARIDALDAELHQRLATLPAIEHRVAGLEGQARRTARRAPPSGRRTRRPVPGGRGRGRARSSHLRRRRRAARHAHRRRSASQRRARRDPSAAR